MKKILAALSFCILFAPIFANTKITVNGTTIEVPDEIATIYKENQSEINAAILKSGATASEIQSVAKNLVNAYNASKSSLGTLTPYTTAKNGLNDFSSELCNVFPNTQAQQNVWAKSWIGYLIPKPHFGVGINMGVATMDISSITGAMKALSISTTDFPDKLVMPTIAADARIGGFFLPFDIGFAICGLDTSNMGLDDKIDPVSADYFSVGGDIRYKVFELNAFETRFSAGAGLYYTKGSIKIDDSEYASGKFEFDTTSFFLSAQASAKFLIFVPFAGMKVMFSKTNVDWSVNDIKWKKILSGNYDSAIEKAIAWKLLPSRVSGGADSGFFEDIHPLVFGGVGLDAGPIDITFSASFDFLSQIGGGAFSLRVAL